MKNKIVLFVCLITALFCFTTNKAQALEICLHGRAGATYENGHLKVCPGFTLNVCATVNITWQDIISIFKKHEKSNINDVVPYLPNVMVTLYDDKGIPTKTINCRITYINEEVLNNPDCIYGEQFTFSGRLK